MHPTHRFARSSTLRPTLGLSLVLALLAGAACSQDVRYDEPIAGANGAIDPSVNGKLDRVLAAALLKGGQGMPRDLLSARQGVVAGQSTTLVDVFIHAETAALPQLQALGVNVRTITKGGVMTATVPLHQLTAVAALSNVTRIEAAKRMNKQMDVSRGPSGLNIPAANQPSGAAHTGGAGVVVGVLDTGIDWSHDDFRDAGGNTRVYAVWDQSDYGDGNVPSIQKNYGYVYDQADVQACIDGTGSYCAQLDVDGHGSHVAGTAAGNGRANDGLTTSEYQYAGVAPEATLVVVKFDFDGSRNSDAAIVDGIDWIFEKAAELGMPAVINLSLGSDFGPHDGSTLEERGIDDLTGAGKIVVAAAGNPGRNHDSDNVALWGRPLHGGGTIPSGGYSDITVEVPSAAAGDYVFFDIWYEGGNKTQIQVISPTNQAYPSSFAGPSKRTWLTGSPTTYYATSEGSIIVGNGGDELGWGTNNGDHELYVELSDYGNQSTLAAGTWTIRIWDRGQTESGAYNGWYGTSGALTTTTVSYEGNLTDNVMTVGTPATAANVISVGAYTTKMSWEYLDLNASDGTCVPGTPCCMVYNQGPLSYYDPYYVDSNDNGVFDYSFDPGACTLASSEPFNQLAFFSARGPNRLGDSYPDIAAPGVGIVATLSSATLAAENAQTDVNNTYFRRTNRVLADGLHAVLQGTSMACPHGTGSVALLLEKNHTLTPADVRGLLGSSAKADGDTGSVPNGDWGYGKVDVTAALAATPEPPPGCSTAAECGSPSSECTVATCVASTCGEDTLADDTPCSSGLCCGGSCGAPACNNDADCGGLICQNAGTCTAACVSASCVGDPCDSNADCCSGFKCSGKPGSKTCKGG